MGRFHHPSTGCQRAVGTGGEAVLDPSAIVVVVSQGTVDLTDPTRLIIPTLQALQGGQCVVVATTAGARTAELRERFASPRVVIEDFVDYEALFQHAAVFVTNGGFGSVLAAMRHGVPIVAAGKTEGKNDIDARVGHNRLGIDLRTERPNRAASAEPSVRLSGTRPIRRTSRRYGLRWNRSIRWPASRWR